MGPPCYFECLLLLYFLKWGSIQLASALAATLKYNSKRTKADDFSAKISKKIPGTDTADRPYRSASRPTP